jgi:hypothetical protein
LAPTIEDVDDDLLGWTVGMTSSNLVRAVCLLSPRGGGPTVGVKGEEKSVRASWRVEMVRLLVGVLLCAVALQVGGCSGDEPESAPTPEAMPVEPMFTDEEAVVIEDYVDAWNAQDVDAIVAMHNHKGSSAEQIRCVYEVAFQEDLRMTVDFDQNVYEITNTAGDAVRPFDDPYFLTLETFQFDRDGDFIGTSIPTDMAYLPVTGPRSDMAAAMDRCYAEEDDQ